MRLAPRAPLMDIARRRHSSIAGNTAPGFTVVSGAQHHHTFTASYPVVIDQLLRAFGQEGLTEESGSFAICMFGSQGRRKGTKLPNPPGLTDDCGRGRRGV